jgi:hypothetical protein
MLSFIVSMITKDLFMSETSILPFPTWRERGRRDREHSDGIRDKLVLPRVTFLISKSFVTLCHYTPVLDITENVSPEGV